MPKARTYGIAVGMVAALFLSALRVQAEPIEDFYRGKTLRMLIGYGPGGRRVSAAAFAREADDHRAEHAGRGELRGGELYSRRRAQGWYGVRQSCPDAGARQHDQHQCKSRRVEDAVYRSCGDQ